ncbi:MAG TPA: hypothetical protein VFK10_09615 [Burkholderiaceae bacterium]|nr:hypothetical protein [Burkholderiaceae bacterium]
MCPNRLHAFAATTALLGILATPICTHAQSSMDLPGDTSMGGAVIAPQQGQQARTMFFGTIAALLAQGLGSALSQGLSTSITRWFESSKSERPPRTADAPSRVVGVAYEVHVLDGNGGSYAVDPARHVFHTGDRFQVHFRPALPGRITVSNVDPRGNESRIDQSQVAAGQLATLGPYRFVDSKGRETLKLRLEPCSSPTLTAASRAIVRAQASAPSDASSMRISDCSDALARGNAAKTRAITKTSVDGATSFALDPMERDEMSSGQLMARELAITFQHR